MLGGGCWHEEAWAWVTVDVLGSTAVRTVTLAHAQRARAKLQEQYARSFRVLPAVGAEHVIAEADGTMICTVAPGPRKGKRPRAWEKMRLVAAQAKDSATTFYGATFGSVEETGRRWGHCARQAGWGLNSQLHVVADGAEWIPLQSQEVFGQQATLLCDFFHVSEYISNRKDALDYPRVLALGLPIGSGMIESGHRHVLQARLKKAGTAWLHDHADQIAHLRVLRANRLWQSWWN